MCSGSGFGRTSFDRKSAFGDQFLGEYSGSLTSQHDLKFVNEAQSIPLLLFLYETGTGTGTGLEPEAEAEPEPEPEPEPVIRIKGH